MVQKVKHISFDFWNTLGTPNPVYAQKRSALLADFFETYDDIAQVRYKSVKDTLDYLTEHCQIEVSTENCYKLLGKEFGVYLDRNKALELQKKFEELFLKYPATIDKDLSMYLKTVALTVPLSVGSNTNFISGKMIKKAVLDAYGIPFKFTIFSDEIERSKPHTSFYRLIHTLSGVVNKQEIVHIGDSPCCDMVGPIIYGMQGAKIDNTKGIIDAVYAHIK